MQCLNCDKEAEPGKALCEECLSSAATHHKVSSTQILRAKRELTIEDESDYAGFWLRVAAFLLDNAILSFIFGAVWIWIVSQLLSGKVYITSYYPFVSKETYLAILTSLSLVPLLYTILLEPTRLRGTLGKYILGIEVVSSEGEKISLFKSLVRTLSRFIFFLPALVMAFFVFLFADNGYKPSLALQLLSLLFILLSPLTYLAVAFTQSKRGIHDLIADTYVIKSPRYKALKVVIAIFLICLFSCGTRVLGELILSHVLMGSRWSGGHF